MRAGFLEVARLQPMVFQEFVSENDCRRCSGLQLLQGSAQFHRVSSHALNSKLNQGRK
jgi:sulfatase maturation enzyme AslB (radical SAM superfamily)